MAKTKKQLGVQQILLHPDKETKAVIEYLCEQSGTRYTVSNHCHLITMFPDAVVEANQYWLFVDTDIDLLAIKEANIKYISSSKACQDHLFFEKEFGGDKE